MALTELGSAAKSPICRVSTSISWVTRSNSWRLCQCITAAEYLILGGGGRNRTGVDGFAGLGWIVLDQRVSRDSLSPNRLLSLFAPLFYLDFLRGGESK